LHDGRLEADTRCSIAIREYLQPPIA